MASFFVERAHSLADADYAFGLAAKENWSPAEDEANFFFTFNPDCIFLAKLQPANQADLRIHNSAVQRSAAYGERCDTVSVGCVVLLRYTRQQAHVRLFVVEEGHRGRGCGKQTLLAALASLGSDCNVTVKALDLRVPFYQSVGFHPLWKGARYKFRVSQLAPKISKIQHASENFNILPLEKVDFQSVASFDESVFGESRCDCLKKWLTLPNTYCWAALDIHHKVVGYIASQKPLADSLRNPSYKIRPLFANNLSIAKFLLKRLLEYLSADAVNSVDLSLYIDVPIEAVPEAARLFCDEFDGEFVHGFVRMCSRETKQDFHKSFSSFP